MDYIVPIVLVSFALVFCTCCAISDYRKGWLSNPFSSQK